MSGSITKPCYIKEAILSSSAIVVTVVLMASKIEMRTPRKVVEERMARRLERPDICSSALTNGGVPGKAHRVLKADFNSSHQFLSSLIRSEHGKRHYRRVSASTKVMYIIGGYAPDDRHCTPWRRSNVSRVRSTLHQLSKGAFSPFTLSPELKSRCGLPVARAPIDQGPPCFLKVRFSAVCKICQ